MSHSRELQRSPARCVLSRSQVPSSHPSVKGSQAADVSWEVYRGRTGVQGPGLMTVLEKEGLSTLCLVPASQHTGRIQSDHFI